jgi:Rhodopirellula transposase DDE domain
VAAGRPARPGYPGAARLLITADAGGSNGYRTRARKMGLAALAAETGLDITVCHFPPGTGPAPPSGTSVYGLAAAPE